MSIRESWVHWGIVIVGAVPLSGASIARAQVTINASDMFNQVGQYFRAYANDAAATVPVTGLLGTIGGPQAWNFATGPTEVVYRFDYVTPTAGLGGADFQALGAQVAEQKTDEADLSTRSWLYFSQDPAKGRSVYGFYDPVFSKSQPQSVFASPLPDWPALIRYGDAWHGATVFDSEITIIDDEEGEYSVPLQIGYNSSATVDAYGLAVLPGLGFLDCLRVHELVQYDIAADIGLGGYTPLETDYVLNYYWLCPGRGVAVQITSQQVVGTPPPDSLPGGAMALVRMFETNHPEGGTPPPETIKGLSISLGKTGALLSWTKLAGVNTYRVDYSTDLSKPGNWQPLPAPTTNNFLIDTAANRTNTPTRCYRVVGF
jgi:hypothetical protein